MRIRVVPWGTGAVGGEMITTIIDHRPDLEIVGARVYSDAKNGADIGALVGRHPIGVAASTDPDEILALDADCVLYTPRNTSIDDVCAILASGKNVVTTEFADWATSCPEYKVTAVEVCAVQHRSKFLYHDILYGYHDDEIIGYGSSSLYA